MARRFPIEERLLDPDVQWRAFQTERMRIRWAKQQIRFNERLEARHGVKFGRVPPKPGEMSHIPCPPPVSDEYPLGFIRFLSSSYVGDLDQMGIVTVISSSVCEANEDWSPKKLLDFFSEESFRSEDSPNQWVCWTFHFRKVVVTDYVMIASGLRSWVLEGSIDAWEWFVLDRHTDTTTFESGWSTAYFHVEQEAVECCYLRLTQTGPNDENGHRLSLRAVEFFGTLIEPRYF
jgi:hypothetical protein